MTHQLIAFPLDEAWHVEHVGGADVLELFGTTVLPMPYAYPEVGHCEIRDRLEALNPGVPVEVMTSFVEWRHQVVLTGDDPDELLGLTR